jgi:aminoglycoside 3-N-acetyltransferase
MSVSEESLAREISELGLPQGALVVVHSSYRAIRPVEGGAAAVVRALLRAVGPEGTVVAPTFTTDLLDPYLAPLSEEEKARRREELPCFDPATSPPYKMGAVAAALLRAPGAKRSDHPVTSCAAIGPMAEELVRDHDRDDPEGPRGPIGRIFLADGFVLLLGVGHDADTTIHVAESLLDMPHLHALPDRYPTRSAEGGRGWREVKKTTKCSDGFVKLEPHLEAAGVIRRGRVGSARAQLLRSRDVVRVATELLRREPTALLCEDPDCVHCPTSRGVLAAWTPPPPR